MKRLVALVAAVAMVVAAVAIRSNIDDDAAAPTARSSSAAMLRCVADLADICAAAAATMEVPSLVEPLPDAVAEFTSPDIVATDTVWVTLAPLDQLVSDARLRAGRAPLLGDSVVVAAAPLVGLGWRERLATLPARCRDMVTTCLTDRAGVPWTRSGGQATWGSVKVVLADPDTSVGALSVAALSARWFANSSEPAVDDPSGLAAGDLQSAAFRDWLRRVLRSPATRPDDISSTVVNMLSRGPAVGDLTVAPGPVIDGLLDGAARSAELVRHDDLGVEMRIVAVTLRPGGVVDAAVIQAVRAAATEVGWRSPPAADTTGLPAGGVVEALVALARELT